MTAFSFILGVIPLVVATGAGSGSRTALGTAVFGGMSLATVLGVIFIPVFYVVVQKLRDPSMPLPDAGGGEPSGDAPGGGQETPDGPPSIDSTGPEPATGAARSMRPAHPLAVLLVASFAASGCMVGPDYVKPESPMPNGSPAPDAWHIAATAGMEQGEATLQTWWSVFNDPTLDGLIGRARAQNLDISQALARIQEARAFVGVVSSVRLPVVDITGQVPVGNVGDAAQPEVFPADTAVLLSVGIGASWEIDVFGRVARGTESAVASYDAAIEDYRDVMVSLYAEVAFGYVEARALQDRIRFAMSNIESQRDSLQLTRDRFAAGLTSALDVAQAEQNLYDTEAAIPPLYEGLQFALNRLAVLLALAPGALDEELEVPGHIPVPPDEVAVGIPLDLVRQRPDLRRAERLLASQTARIGVATADLYPSFSLSGAVTFDVGNIGDTTGFGWNFLPGFRWNIFDPERVHNRVRVEEAVTEQAFLAYELTMLSALEDVENSMIAYALEQERRAHLIDAVDASSRAVELVRTQYLAGLTNFQNLLDSQRSLFQLQDQLAASEGVVVQNLIFLYRSLGGGWDPTLPADLTLDGSQSGTPEQGVEVAPRGRRQGGQGRRSGR